MSNIVTPNMDLTVPTPGSEPGPLYATEVSNDLVTIDSHDHSTGKGVPVTPAGLNINSDLTFQDNNATNLRSTRLVSNPATLGGVGDLNCVYDVNGNLWFNNGVGTPIQITSGSIVDVSGPVIYNTFATANNYAIATTDPYVMIACDPTSNVITITLPAASGVPTGRFYIVKDSTGKSQTHNITVTPNGLNTIDGIAGSLIMNDNFWSVGFVSDGTSNWRVLKWNKYNYLSGENLNFSSGSEITGATLIASSAELFINGYEVHQGIFAYTATVVNSFNSPYTISSGPPVPGPSVLFLVNTGSACTINLPSLASSVAGMTIIIKDYTGTAATNNISIVPFNTDEIEGINATYLIQANFGMITLVSCETALLANWAMI